MITTPIKGKAFGATIIGITLETLTDAEFAAIHSALLEFGFLVFPGQFLSDEGNIALGSRFGELEFGALPLANQVRHRDGTLGAMAAIDSEWMKINRGNEAWHTDSTYRPISSKVAMLSAVKLPSAGGQTEFADMRAGYATLPEPMKETIAGFAAYHSTVFSQANDLGHFPEIKPDSIYHGEAYLRPLVKTHPETGVKNLLIGRHAFGIPGLSRDESRSLLDHLMAHVLGDESRVYSHEWTEGDTLIWDNRALLHRARAYDYREPRVLIGTRVQGDVPSELAYYPEDPAAEAGRQALTEELSWLRQRSAA